MTTISGVFGTRSCVDALNAHAFGPDVKLSIEHAKPVHRAFPAVVNEVRYDIAELAIVTALQAIDMGRPLSLLPVTVLGRFQHHCLVTLDPGITSVDKLVGKRIGVRSWSQTTGVWVRGIVQSEYGLDPRQVEWIVYEGGHVAGAAEPTFLKRASDGASLPTDFLAGAVDVAILGNELPDDPRVRTVLADPAREASAWYGRTGAIPLNHMVVVTDELLARNPGLVAEVARVLVASMPATPRISSTPDFYPSGFDAVAASLDLVARYAFEQGIISRPIGAAQLREKAERLSGLDLGTLG